MKALYLERVRGIRKYFLTSVITILVISCSVLLGSAHNSPLTSISGERAMPTGSLGLGAGATYAHDRSDCDRMFASANVEKVKTFKANTNNVDFGDEPHFANAPVGDAVICWSIDGRVGVRGKLYSDNNDPQTARVYIRFKRTGGSWTNWTWRSKTTNGGWVGNKQVEKVSPVGSFNRVRIRLKLYTQTDLGTVNAYVYDEEFTR